MEDMGTFVRFWVHLLWKFIVFGDRGNTIRPNPTINGASSSVTVLYVHAAHSEKGKVYKRTTGLFSALCTYTS